MILKRFKEIVGNPEKPQNQRLRKKIKMRCDMCYQEYIRWDRTYQKMIHNKYYDQDYCDNCWRRKINSTEEHSKKLKEAMKKPEYRKKRSSIMRKIASNPEWRKKQAAILKEVYKDPEMKKRISEAVKKHYRQNPEKREIMAVRMRRRYIEQPELKEDMSKKLKEIYKDPKMREKISKAVKNAHKKNPTIKKRISDGLKAVGANIGDKNGMKQIEARKKVSLARKKMFKDPAVRKKYSDAMKKAWADGKFDGVAVGKCKWHSYKHSNGNIYKVQGTWELAFIKWLDKTELHFLCHRGRIPYKINGETKNYYPDFWVEEWQEYIDVKCRHFYKKEKFAAIRISNPDKEFKVLFRDDMRMLGVDL